MADRNPISKRLTLRTRFCYGVGHILNDLCASMWFTYLLVYLHKVVSFSNIAAGSLLLIGQIADAISTPLVGIESDKTRNSSYGRRKIWHLVGVICVTLTFPFIFNLCITCEHSSTWALFMYYSPFIIIFQFGWASTQISHLSLIPELTNDEHEKATLNTIRYACTVASNIFVFCVAWVLLDSLHAKDTTKLTAEDSPAFMYLVFIVIGTGLLFMIIFHCGVKEPPRTCAYALATCSKSKRSACNWTSWFRECQFYQVGVLYMCTRLIVNITQVYLPMYLISTLQLQKNTIAIMPLIVFSSGFVATFFAKPSIHYLGRKGTFLIGLLVIMGTCAWLWFLPPHTNQIYGTSATLGIGGSWLLVTALTMTADLIGSNKETGAFVYGAMSFVDKLSNGVAIQLIQALHPCKEEVCCHECNLFYREVMVFVAGGASIIALITLITLARTTIGSNEQDADMDPSVQEKLLSNGVSVSANLSDSINGTNAKGALSAYDPPARYQYGTMEYDGLVNYEGTINCSLQADVENRKVTCKKLDNCAGTQGTNVGPENNVPCKRLAREDSSNSRDGGRDVKCSVNADPKTEVVGCKKHQRTH